MSQMLYAGATIESSPVEILCKLHHVGENCDLWNFLSHVITTYYTPLHVCKYGCAILCELTLLNCWSLIRLNRWYRKIVVFA